MKIVVLLFLALSATFLYGYTVDDFFDNPFRQKIDGEPMFVGEKRIITADDGIEFSMYQLNPCYEQQYFINDGNFIVYFVLCTEEKHILFDVFVVNDFFVEGKYDYKFTITKDKEFKNVILYRAFVSYEKSDGTVSTPVDTEFAVDRNGNDKYCGSYGLPYVELANVKKETKENRAYYNDMEDFIIYDVEDIMSRAKETVYNGKIFFTSNKRLTSIQTFMLFNPDSREGLQHEIDELKLMEKEIKEYESKVFFLSLYSLPVSMAAKDILWNELRKKDVPARPDIKGELPTNEEELCLYLQWIKMGFEFANRFGLNDRYGTPLTFELVEEGLKVKSADEDKEWDTEDDLWVIRHYDGILESCFSKTAVEM